MHSTTGKWKRQIDDINVYISEIANITSHRHYIRRMGDDNDKANHQRQGIPAEMRAAAMLTYYWTASPSKVKVISQDCIDGRCQRPLPLISRQNGIAKTKLGFVDCPALLEPSLD